MRLERGDDRREHPHGRWQIAHRLQALEDVDRARREHHRTESGAASRQFELTAQLVHQRHAEDREQRHDHERSVCLAQHHRRCCHLDG